LRERISPELLYTRRFRSFQLLSSEVSALISYVQRLYELDLLHWIEMMSLVCQLDEVVESLRAMAAFKFVSPTVPRTELGY
jgi:hypothetical protein